MSVGEIMARPEFMLSVLLIIVGTVVAVALSKQLRLPTPAAFRPSDHRVQWQGEAGGPWTSRPISSDWAAPSPSMGAPAAGGGFVAPAGTATLERPATRGPRAADVQDEAVGNRRNKGIKPERPRVTFADVAGEEEAVEELMEIRQYLMEPNRFRTLGATLPKGILLFGPPGTGKTLMARALAGEAGVPFYSMSAASFVEMFVGVGASRVRELFKEAHKERPSIIFIDELDAIGRHRGSATGGNEEREATLNQLLVEMDGFDSGEGVLVLAATNRVDVLDPALLRSGRFDRRVGIDLPDARGREAILKIHTRAKPLSEKIDLKKIAAQTVGLSGADLANIANEAALLAARQRAATIEIGHMHEAIERVLAGPTRRSRILSQKERNRIAYHEAGHAIAAAALPAADPVTKVSIVARGQSGGYTWFTPSADQILVTRSQLEDRIAAMLAGRVCEEMVFGETSSGAHDDLDKAAELALKMVTKFGMGNDRTPLPLTRRAGIEAQVAPSLSEKLASRIEKEAEGILSNAQERAKAILTRNRRVVEDLTAALLAKESIEGPALKRLLKSVTPAGAAV